MKNIIQKFLSSKIRMLCIRLSENITQKSYIIYTTHSTICRLPLHQSSCLVLSPFFSTGNCVNLKKNSFWRTNTLLNRNDIEYKHINISQHSSHIVSELQNEFKSSPTMGKRNKVLYSVHR